MAKVKTEGQVGRVSAGAGWNIIRFVVILYRGSWEVPLASTGLVISIEDDGNDNDGRYAVQDYINVKDIIRL